MPTRTPALTDPAPAETPERTREADDDPSLQLPIAPAQVTRADPPIELATREREENPPCVAEAISTENVLEFRKKATRGRKKKTTEKTLRVDYVKASKNTWAFRIRWTEGEQTPVVYVSRVSDKLFNSITKGKIRYAAFKKQLIASYLSRAVRQSDGTDAGSNRTI